MRTIHDAAREVLYAKELPTLEQAGLCRLFRDMADGDSYQEMSDFSENGSYFAYLGTPGVWTEDRLIFVLLLAETDPADFEPAAVSEVETLMLHGMTHHEAELAAKSRLSGSIGPYYPDRGGLAGWLLGAFVWADHETSAYFWVDTHSRLYAKDENGYDSINRP